MPYIPRIQRPRLDAFKTLLKEIEVSLTAGELNYLISSLVHAWLQKKEKIGYAEMNEVMGVLECMKLELYRQVISPYEDKKKNDNGSVSNLDDNSFDHMR